MKKSFLLIIICLFILSITLMACTQREVESQELDFEISRYTDNISYIKEIKNTKNYISDLAENNNYDDVKEEMALLNIDEDAFNNSNVKYFYTKITTNYIKHYGTSSEYVSEDEYNTSETVGPQNTSLDDGALNMYDIYYTKFITSLSKSTVISNGNERVLVSVSCLIQWQNNISEGEYEDIIDIEGDENMDSVDSMNQINDYVFSENNKMLVYDESFTIIPYTAEMDYFPIANSNIYGASYTWDYRGEYGRAGAFIIYKDYTISAEDISPDKSKYYCAKVSYAQSTRDIAFNSIKVGFTGLSFNFTYKQDYNIYSSISGFWLIDDNTEISEGIVYGIRNKKNTGFLNLLNRWMVVEDTAIEEGADITTESNTLNKLNRLYVFLKCSDSAGVYWEISPYYLLGYRLGVAADSTIELQAKNNSNNQKFRFVKYDNTYYSIRNYSNTMCLGLNGNDVKTEAISNATDQLWTFRAEEISDAPYDNGYMSYLVKNKNSGLYFDIYGNNPSENGNLVQHNLNGGRNQLFRLQYVSGGDFLIVPQYISQQPPQSGSKCLDVYGALNQDGANITVYSYHGGNNQLFKIVRRNNGYYKILTKVSGYTKCISVEGASISNAANIYQYTYQDTTSSENHDNNLWKFV